MIATTSWSSPRSSRAAAIPRAAEIDVEACPTPKVSYSDSDRFVKPDRPPFWRIVCSCAFRPVRTLWG